MSVKLLTEHHFEFLSLKGGCTGLSEYSCQNATLMEITCRASFMHSTASLLCIYLAGFRILACLHNQSGKQYVDPD